jgi:DMSO/TMAO reductase YedYZ heme-binding membrane subunit/nitrite reductase/ring-hydroxylating ferredoxin subunit
VSHIYKSVQWTPFKRNFDATLAVCVVAFVAAFVAAALREVPARQTLSEVQIAIRATGAAAFALLSVILAIGPLARLTTRALPLLYNRRHLGVTCFLLALTHAGLVIVWYHGFADRNPFVSLITSNPRYDGLQGFPFESLGLGALLVLYVMAATSHDFWNANLGPALWKGLHMAAYPAYALLVAHILLGAVQSERGWIYPGAALAAAATLSVLHVIAARRETRFDATPRPRGPDGWIEAGPAATIPDKAARIVLAPGGERIAVFRDGEAIYALSNVCRHQGGPLGEGRIVDGCVTCPWHGFQYRPEDGRAPAPYAERVATFATRLVDGTVYVDPEPRA